MVSNDPSAASRKKDHIELAFQSQVENMELDGRFYYEPMLSGFRDSVSPVKFLGKTLRAPIWVSSMTGGTEMAGRINANLARACATFGMGMGLGSCRSLLDSDEYLDDFNVRPIMGPDVPLFANLGIAQVEELVRRGQTSKAVDLLNKLDADGLFIHVNPLQEWLQPEGDRIAAPPVDTIQAFLDLHPDVQVAVKEVGQGMGVESLHRLMELPLAAIEFAAHGGTNFSKLELLRSDRDHMDQFLGVARIGHSAADMVGMVNDILDRETPGEILCRNFIISGGVRNFLDGYYLVSGIRANAVYGQASALLRYAAVSYEELERFLTYQLKGYAMAEAYLRIR